MLSKSKKVFYLYEGVNAFASVYYSNYLFFYMKEAFGFGDLENLLLAALNGFVYIFGSWQGGKFAQKNGNVRSIGIGTSGLIFALLSSLLFNGLWVLIAAYIIWTVSICFIWPAIEAVVSEGASGDLSSRVGIYNIVWAGTAATAYFVTGYMLEKFGMKSLFWFPLILHGIQLIVLLPLSLRLIKKESSIQKIETDHHEMFRPDYSRKFLHMAWISNPFSYIAISTILPLIPTISSKMGLSTTLAGIVCSVWMFARLAAFLTLWKWNGWHYRFRWLLGAFFVMISAYAGMLLAKTVLMLILSQIAFGLSIGIIYYSSLYYSMHASGEKGANGGLHEAMIGGGLFAGPAFGAACIYLIPSAAQNSGMPVNILLTIGLMSVAWMGRFRIRKKQVS